MGIPHKTHVTELDFVFWPASLGGLPFQQQLAVASAGRFSSLAVSPSTFRKLTASGLSADALLDMAAQHHVRLDYLDGMTGWAPVRYPAACEPWIRDIFDFSMEEALEVCKALRMKSLVAVGSFDRGQVPLPDLISAFARLCDQAAARGLWVDLEFIPMWGIRDLPMAWEIVNGARRDNCGIMVDTWHLHKGSTDLEHDLSLLRSIPGERLVNVQVADALKAPRAASLFDDCVHYRKFPGEGELAVREILAIVRHKQGLRSIGPEIFSDEINALAPEEAGKRAGETTRRLLAQVDADLARQ